MRDSLANEYFEWMYKMVCGKRFSKKTSYRKLLMYLHNTVFIYSIRGDANRAADGVDLRRRFALIHGYENYIYDYLDEDCSVLEMMLALSIRCEETIMDDPSIGDRTSQWFWGMITNLGLGDMNDERFDKKYVTVVIDKFLNRDYSPTGEGGLFKIKNGDKDLRDVEIWYQLCWYLDNIT